MALGDDMLVLWLRCKLSCVGGSKELVALAFTAIKHIANRLLADYIFRGYAQSRCLDMQSRDAWLQVEVCSVGTVVCYNSLVRTADAVSALEHSVVCCGRASCPSAFVGIGR